MDKQFEVTISFDITCGGQKFSDYALNYHNLSYDRMQELQSTIARALLALGDAGKTKT